MAITGDAETGRPTALPARKVAAGGVAGTVATMAIWLCDTCGLPVAPEAAAALTAMATVAASYATPPAPTEAVLPREDELPLRHFG